MRSLLAAFWSSFSWRPAAPPLVLTTKPPDRLLRVTLTRSAARRLLHTLTRLAEAPSVICGVMESATTPMVRLYFSSTAPSASLHLLLSTAGDVQVTDRILEGDGALHACGEQLRTLLGESAIGDPCPTSDRCVCRT